MPAPLECNASVYGEACSRSCQASRPPSPLAFPVHHNIPRMRRSPLLRRAPIIQQHLRRRRFHHNPRRRTPKPRNPHPLRRAEAPRPDHQRHIRSRCPIVPHRHRNQPPRALSHRRCQLSRSDIDNRQIRQSTIVQHPIIKEPLQVFRRSLLHHTLKPQSILLRCLRRSRLHTPSLQRLLQCIVTGQITQHPPNRRSFAPIVKLTGSRRQWLTHRPSLTRFKRRLGQSQRPQQRSKLSNRSLAPLRTLNAQEHKKLRQPLIHPRPSSLYPRMGQAMR